MKPRIACLEVWLVAALAGVAAHVSAAEPRRPNVVVILSDDQGWGDLSLNGNTNLATPHLDSLAKDGAVFERFFVSPVCSPTRAEFLTGRYHLRAGVRDVSTGGERLNLDERTIADTFRAAGYRTGAFGKWHNGTQYPYHPNGRGFDEFYGFTSGHWGEYFDPPLDHNGARVRGRGFLADDLTEHALEFIAANRARPFFCYVPLNTPHSPMQVPERFHAKFAAAPIALRGRAGEGEDIAFTRAALAMCENIDWNVGRILRRLDELALADDTIVLFFSDNGPLGTRWNGDMKGRKGLTDEGGVRSPLLVRWPGRIAPGTRVREIGAAIDLLPTLADLTGVALDNTKPLDGVSLRPLFVAPLAAAWPERMIFSHWNGRVSVRTPRFRLDSEGQLFDMPADPGQRLDVAAEHAETAATLRAAVARWRGEMRAGKVADDRPFPVGHRAFPETELPARDGRPHGSIVRSAPAPNCSFFTHWQQPGDAMTWDVEVVTGGRYEISVDYTCAAEDVGSIIELGFGDCRLEATVERAHNPPLRGAEHDRVPRKGESYVKDFQPLRLGVVELPAGRGLLVLRAVKIAGRAVMDVRGLRVRLLP